jgi:hypothetical protein
MRHRPAAPDDRRVPAVLPGALAASERGSLHPATRTWPPYWRDRHLRFALCDELEPSPDIGGLLRETGRDPAAIFWGQAVQAETFARCRYLTVPLPARACPAPCSLGHEQFRDLMDCAGLSPGNPVAATLPERLWRTCL